MPNGWVIEYFEKPRGYKIDGEPVVSVTEALECLDKPALPWWGMTVGVRGLHALMGMGIAVPTKHPEHGHWCLAHAKNGRWEEATVEDLVDLLTTIKATVNHKKDEGGKRGQSAHDAFEAWGVTGELPDPKQYSFEEEPYVRALRDFLEILGSDWETEAQEIVVGSKQHGFAGRFDMKGRLAAPKKVVTKVYPKNPPKTVEIPAGRGILDLKTSKDVYFNHALQLEAYEGAGVECGHEPTDWRAVLQVGADGRYQLRITSDKGITVEDYAVIVQANDVVRRAKEAIKV